MKSEPTHLTNIRKNDQTALFNAREMMKWHLNISKYIDEWERKIAWPQNGKKVFALCFLVMIFDAYHLEIIHYFQQIHYKDPIISYWILVFLSDGERKSMDKYTFARNSGPTSDSVLFIVANKLILHRLNAHNCKLFEVLKHFIIVPASYERHKKKTNNNKAP